MAVHDATLTYHFLFLFKFSMSLPTLGLCMHFPAAWNVLPFHRTASSSSSVRAQPQSHLPREVFLDYPTWIRSLWFLSLSPRTLLSYHIAMVIICNCIIYWFIYFISAHIFHIFCPQLPEGRNMPFVFPAVAPTPSIWWVHRRWQMNALWVNGYMCVLTLWRFPSCPVDRSQLPGPHCRTWPSWCYTPHSCHARCHGWRGF